MWTEYFIPFKQSTSDLNHLIKWTSKKRLCSKYRIGGNASGGIKVQGASLWQLKDSSIKLLKSSDVMLERCRKCRKHMSKTIGADWGSWPYWWRRSQYYYFTNDLLYCYSATSKERQYYNLYKFELWWRVCVEWWWNFEWWFLLFLSELPTF